MQGQLICLQVHQDRGNNLTGPGRPFTLPFSDIGCCQVDSAADLFPCGRPEKVTVRALTYAESQKAEMETNVDTVLL